MSKEKNILVFIDWYRPGYRAGGPIRSLANLVDRLPFQFWIVTSIYDHYAEEPYPNIPQNEWQHRTDNEHVMYLGPGGMNKKLVQDLLNEREYDLVYLNSLFSMTFALKPLRYIQKIKAHPPILLAPRGMLKAGALSVKAGKKKAFLKIAKTFNLFKGITWHATNDTEADEIRQHFGSKQNIRVAPNLPKAASGKRNIPSKKPGELHLVTIARVSPEKGTLEGLQAIAKVRGNVKWDIYGTLQSEEYVQQCRSLAEELDADISFHGEIEPTRISEKIEAGHFFFLTTLGENYGHAIAESFLSGVPVVISDRTPWKDLAVKNAGWELPLEGDAISKQLQACLEMNEEAYLTLCESTLEFGKEIALAEEAIQANIELFR